LRKEPDDRYQTIDELASALSAELKGQSQVSLNLESGAFRKVDDAETATRDEVERYERRLQRREQLTRASGIALILLGGFGAYHFYRESTKAAPFDGKEREPNHDVATATPVPFGEEVVGMLGKRISKERGDQDNFLIQVPEQPGKQRTSVQLHLSALPNMGVCIFIFQRGVETPQEQFCSGTHARGTDIKKLELRPGPYLIAVRQDLNQYAEGESPLLHENVSDKYTLLVKSGGAAADWETEPNQDETSADLLSLDGIKEMQGVQNTMKDRDVVCAKGTGFGKFIVTDADDGKRPIHAALRVTPLGGPSDKIPLRLHAGRPGIEWTERDQPSPWTSPSVDLSLTPCVALELVPNPWAPRPHPITPPASDHEWRVELVETEEPSSEDVAPASVRPPK
jgi:hypothetical protein